MKEELISLETEKLAKEKGFNFGSSTATQSLLQRWFREKHNFIIWVECMFFDGFAYIPSYEFKVLDFFDSVELYKEWELIFDVNHDTYEKALEKILFEALKLIKL